MSTDLDVFMANVKKAVLDYDSAMIGGGLFSPSELRQVLTDVSELKRRAINAEKEVKALKEINERLEHDQKLLLEALKQVLDYLLCDDAKTMHDAIQVAKRANAAYRHVTGTRQRHGRTPHHRQTAQVCSVVDS